MSQNRSNRNSEDELNRNFSRSLSLSAQPQPQPQPQPRVSNQNPYLNRSQSISVQPQPKIDQHRNRTRILRPGNYDEPRDMNDVFRILNQLKNRNLPEHYEDDDHVDLTREDDDHDRFIYIPEALKGAQMNQTWKRKIFSQCPEDDDEELRKEIDNRLKMYDPYIAHDYWADERYSILERRQYERDVSTTQGFEVGYYPYLMRNSSSLIIRYYCPPDANLPDDSIVRLYSLAVDAINFYNARQQTNYSVVKVIKTMTDFAAGTWFYMTFQASIPCYGDHLWTFEAKLFRSIPCPQTCITVDFVRLKMGAGPSSLIQEPYAANLIQEPQACCSSSSFINPFAGQ